MELTKNIFFNTDKLVENSKVKISYIGQLYQDASSEVSVHYGFGINWDNVNDIKMEKTELGFQAEIELGEGDTFNFCFKDVNNNWDNNNAKNYSANISKEEVTVSKVETTALEVPKLKKSYLIAKKIRIAFYKMITAIPKVFSGEFKKKAAKE